MRACVCVVCARTRTASGLARTQVVEPSRVQPRFSHLELDLDTGVLLRLTWVRRCAALCLCRSLGRQLNIERHRVLSLEELRSREPEELRSRELSREAVARN